MAILVSALLTIAFIFVFLLIFNLANQCTTLNFFKCKTKKSIVLAYMPIAILFFVFSGIASSKFQNVAPMNTKNENANSVSSGKNDKLKKQNSSNKSLTENDIKDAITDRRVKDKISLVKVDKGNITIAIYSDDFLDEEDIIRQNQPDSAQVFQDLFKNKNIKTVTYAVFVPTNDEYGKKSPTLAITSVLDRQNANKVADWNVFKHEAMSQYYSVVKFQLAPESKIKGLHAAWESLYDD